MSNVPLKNLFSINYGTDKELNILKRKNNGINFVARNRNNNGVVAKVEVIPGITPNPAGSISVALGSSSVLFAFVQDEPYYSGRDLAYLVPKLDMSKKQKLFYCMCLLANRYKYNYGRQANKTIDKILVPDLGSIPDWINDVEIKDISYYSKRHTESHPITLDLTKWKKFMLVGDNGLFEYERGTMLNPVNSDQ